MKYLLFSGMIVTLIVPTIQEKTLIICEKEDETLSCDKGVIRVTNGTFGRIKNVQKCGFSFILRSCVTDVTANVSGLCDGQTTCQIKATKKLFGNECKFRWIQQHLKVVYQCIEEHKTMPVTTTPSSTSTIMIETTQEETTMLATTKSKLDESNSTTDVLSETEINRMSSQHEEPALGDATGPVIGFVSGIVLIILIVFITLRQKKKRRKYQYKKRENSSSYLNKTYDSAIYRPKNNSANVSSSCQGHVKSSPTYENVPTSSPCLNNKLKSDNSSAKKFNDSCAKRLNNDKSAVEVALVHDLKQSSSGSKKGKKRANEYVYTSVKNNEVSSSNKNKEKQNQKDNNYDFPKPKNNLTGNESRETRRKDAGCGNMDTLKCDSYYVDMSLTDGKTKDIDIKYVTMNRNAKLLDDVSIHLYVNDMNSHRYCNIQIQNKDKNSDGTVENNNTGSDVFYDNVPRNKPRAVEDSVYEPYHVGE